MTRHEMKSGNQPPNDLRTAAKPLGHCVASDPNILQHVFSSLTATIEHDDRGSQIRLSMPPQSCSLCAGAWVIENRAARAMAPCPVSTRVARVKELLSALAPDDPDSILRQAASVSMSPALVDRLHTSVVHRIGASFSVNLPPVALAARAAWIFGARTGVFSASDAAAAARPPGSPELVFVHLDNKPWEQGTSEIMEQWISWCQRAGSALWVSAPPMPAQEKDGSAASVGWGRVSRQISARVAKARERHWSGWLSSQARSRLMEVCEANAMFDK